MSSTSTGKNLIVVFGATGAAGGSVAKYLLDDGTFAVRAVTRNADSPAAQALKAGGAQVVVADLDKPDTLPAAVKGAYGVSAVTDFWTLFPKFGDAVKTQHAEEAQAQGKALVDAAKAAGVQHFVFFTLWHSDVPHFEGKHQINEYLKASGVPRTSFYNSAYFESLTIGAFSMLSKASDGTLHLSIPIPEDAYVPSYSVDQSGGWVLEAFKNPGTYIGKDIIAIGEHVRPSKFARILSAALGSDVKVKPLSREAFYAMAHSPDPVVVEVFLNMKYFYEHCQPPNSKCDEDAAKRVFPGRHNFEEFVAKNEKFLKFVSEFK